jgi:hypothetical protein
VIGEQGGHLVRSRLQLLHWQEELGIMADLERN